MAEIAGKLKERGILGEEREFWVFFVKKRQKKVKNGARHIDRRALFVYTTVDFFLEMERVGISPLFFIDN